MTGVQTCALPILVGASRGDEELDEPLHAADRRGLRGTPESRGPGERRPGSAGAAAALPEALRAERAARRLRTPAGLAGGLRVREDDPVHLGRLRDAHHAVPV